MVIRLTFSCKVVLAYCFTGGIAQAHEETISFFVGSNRDFVSGYIKTLEIDRVSSDRIKK